MDSAVRAYRVRLRMRRGDAYDETEVVEHAFTAADAEHQVTVRERGQCFDARGDQFCRVLSVRPAEIPSDAPLALRIWDTRKDPT